MKKTVIGRDPSDRVKELIKEQGITQGILADKIGVNISTIARICNGKQRLTEKLAKAIIDKFPVYRKMWLLGFEDVKERTSEWVSTDTEDLEFPCIVFEGGRIKIPDEIVTINDMSFSCKYFEFLAWACGTTSEGLLKNSEEHKDFLKHNCIKFWMPLPEFPDKMICE